MQIQTEKVIFQIHNPDSANPTIYIWRNGRKSTITGAEAKNLQRLIEAEKDEYLDRLNSLLSAALEQNSKIAA